MKPFLLTVVTPTETYCFCTVAASAAAVGEVAAERYADVPCGITVHAMVAA